MLHAEELAFVHPHTGERLTDYPTGTFLKVFLFIPFC